MRSAGSFVDKIDVADLSGERFERMGFCRKIMSTDVFHDICFWIGHRLTSIDVSIEAVFYQCHRSQQTHGSGAENNRAVTMRVRFPGSDWAVPWKALLHVPNLNERLLRDR